ncbi:MAG: hypothetical protein R3A47_02570 [Polyangiales bacterium]
MVHVALRRRGRVRQSQSNMTDVQIDQQGWPRRLRGRFQDTEIDALSPRPDVILVLADATKDTADAYWTRLFQKDTDANQSKTDTQRYLRENSTAPIVAYAARPPRLPAGAGLSRVLSGMQSAGVVFKSLDDQTVLAAARLGGDFPSTVEENIQSFFRSMSESILGRVLGFGTGLKLLRAQRDGKDLNIDVSANVDLIAQGLRDAFIANINELLNH